MTKFGCLKTDWCVFLYLANKEVENIDFPLGEKWFTKFVGIKIEFYVLYLTLKKKFLCSCSRILLLMVK